jgi:DNA-3-methyladenine glycosylase
MKASRKPGTSSSFPRLEAGFFRRDVLEVAPDLLGKVLARRLGEGTMIRARITEVEAYRGTEDLACHASRGKTERTRVMFGPAGFVYVYLIYGMYWMLNFVTGPEGIPQAVLLRGVDSVEGPGRLARHFGINRDFYAEDLCSSHRLWVEDHPGKVEIAEGPRIGVKYAGEYWASRPWRFTACLSSSDGVKKT